VYRFPIEATHEKKLAQITTEVRNFYILVPANNHQQQRFPVCLCVCIAISNRLWGNSLVSNKNLCRPINIFRLFESNVIQNATAKTPTETTRCFDVLKIVGSQRQKTAKLLLFFCLFIQFAHRRPYDLKMWTFLKYLKAVSCTAVFVDIGASV
jgi:hypothetical protein